MLFFHIYTPFSSLTSHSHLLQPSLMYTHQSIPVMEVDGRWKSHVHVAPNCPRCASTNTKFCYYNNYSLAQPRYFCKDCRRYWTKGGSLRNVPVGGGCRRKSRRRSRSNPHPSPSPLPDPPSSSSPQIDLAAVFARYVNQGPAGPVPTRVEESSFDQGFMDEALWSTWTDEGGSSNIEERVSLGQQEFDYYSSPSLDQFSNVSTDSILDDFNWSCLDDQLTGFQMEISADQL